MEVATDEVIFFKMIWLNILQLLEQTNHKIDHYKLADSVCRNEEDKCWGFMYICFQCIKS
jgi:hypothetical protein